MEIGLDLSPVAAEEGPRPHCGRHWLSCARPKTRLFDNAASSIGPPMIPHAPQPRRARGSAFATLFLAKSANAYKIWRVAWGSSCLNARHQRGCGSQK
eukprot:CAMPEP_0174291940 /NCGR_PEP_ID=MMETSP0809-20121228/33759_1 /TAXON_ID=73025 ORGANISM="Eutreptiella gymnastica-like, Strain CCMP1594" /NCGR_SAMPLE_ID=MMETSP0809 /ASSEMBLY_ACC=CAM_ASM_000658 /LENGTH=97 /DNA_ID=CAMNT_0015391665 /DNA_START=869 /DNA_END=1159 /DNA_ORIENTATION=+